MKQRILSVVLVVLSLGLSVGAAFSLSGLELWLSRRFLSPFVFYFAVVLCYILFCGFQVQLLRQLRQKVFGIALAFLQMLAMGYWFVMSFDGTIPYMPELIGLYAIAIYLFFYTVVMTIFARRKNS